MAKIIINIQSISDAIPKFRIWYRFYDDIFISVICSGNRKSYIRRKTAIQGIKADNSMCAWHSDWQYAYIEYRYGLEARKIRTYEIIVEYEGEIHRIDSLVDTIAIEFQHSLDVSLNEINSRFVAHAALGYTPYLMLDFTDFSSSSTFLKFADLSYKNIEHYIASYKNNDIIISFLKKVRKWFNSEYFNNGNLFLDFSDQILRLTPRLKCKILKYSKEKFIDNLLALENDIQNELATEKDQLEFEKTQRTQEREGAENKRIAEVKRKIKENREAVKSDNRFSWYRKCLQNQVIANTLYEAIGYADYVSYRYYSFQDANILRKYQIYNLFSCAYTEPNVEIQYIINNKQETDQFQFLYSEINLIKKEGEGIKRFVFEQKAGRKIRLIAKRLECVKGILHSIDNAALYIYDEHGRFISKEYYLFNTKVNKEDWAVLREYYEIGRFYNDLEKDKIVSLKNIIETIDKNDFYNFRKYFCQNYLPLDVKQKYYKKIQEQIPLSTKHL